MHSDTVYSGSSPVDSIYWVNPVVTKGFRLFGLLPTDVKCKIFSYLPFGVVKKAALCNKELHDYISPLIDFDFACMGCNHRLVSFKRFVHTMCSDFIYDVAVCVKVDDESELDKKEGGHGFRFGTTTFIPVPTYSSSEHEILQYSYIQKLLGFVSDGELSFSLCDMCCEQCGMFLGLKVCNLGVTSKSGDVEAENLVALQRQGITDGRTQGSRFVLPGVNLNWFALTINEMLNLEHSEENWDENFNLTDIDTMKTFRPIKKGEALLCKQRLNIIDKACNSLITSGNIHCSHCNNAIAPGRAVLNEKGMEPEEEEGDLVFVAGMTAGSYIEEDEERRSSRFAGVVVKDVSCAGCRRRVGWKHLVIPEEEWDGDEMLSSHRHLHGVFCLRRHLITREGASSIRSDTSLAQRILPAEFQTPASPSL